LAILPTGLSLNTNFSKF